MIDMDFYRHIKSGKIYEIIGEAINATNDRDGQMVVIYRQHFTEKKLAKNEKIYVRDIVEFYEKFAPHYHP